MERVRAAHYPRYRPAGTYYGRQPSSGNPHSEPRRVRGGGRRSEQDPRHAVPLLGVATDLLDDVVRDDDDPIQLRERPQLLLARQQRPATSSCLPHPTGDSDDMSRWGRQRVRFARLSHLPNTYRARGNVGSRRRGRWPSRSDHCPAHAERIEADHAPRCPSTASAPLLAFRRT